MVMSEMLTPMAILFFCFRDSGCSKFEVTPGGGFNAGFRVGIGVAMAEMEVDIVFLRSY